MPSGSQTTRRRGSIPSCTERFPTSGSLVLGHADYQWRHEPILYGFAPGGGRRGRGSGGWYGGNAQTSVFEIPRPQASPEHPTMKPVELVRRCLANSSKGTDIV